MCDIKSDHSKWPNLAGPQKAREKGQKMQQKTPEPPNTLEIPKDSVRDPRRAENCQKNAVLCHLAQENAPEERRIVSKVTQKP